MLKPTRLRCESLEARDVPATWTVSTPDELIARMTQANNEAGDDTIVLVANTTYTLTTTNNSTHGPTGLPVVKAKLPDGVTPSGSLTIFGNAAVIERGAGGPTIRLIAVEAGASLTVQNLTLQGGYTRGTATVPARGGGIYNLGTVHLSDVTIQNNTAYGYENLSTSQPSRGGLAQGGGVYSDGTLTISGGHIRDNLAQGGRGANGSNSVDRYAVRTGYSGGSGMGGGVYVAGGTALLTGVAVEGNAARGGAGGDGSKQFSSRTGSDGGSGGHGQGGGISAAGGITTLTDCTVRENTALGGVGGKKGKGSNAYSGAAGTGEGGGIYVGPGVAADWDADTSVTGNTAATGKNVYRT